ncbi:MAG TPA: response regulator transcription factor [Gemmatimonadales bacterium]|nr:response regulator transcription factor [Gemmatimonadales bacterium]
MIRILLAARSPVALAGLEALLGRRDDFQVSGSSGDLAALPGRLAREEADVVVVDVDTGEAALALLDGLEPEARGPALLLLVERPELWASEALRRGGRGVLPRRVAGGELVAAVEAAAAGLVVLHPVAADGVTAARGAPAHRIPEIDEHPLTPRELEVLEMLAEGLANRTIAERLGVSDHTVKFHLASIFAKLGVRTRTEAVTQGIRRGWIML